MTWSARTVSHGARDGSAALVVDAVGSEATRAASVALLQPAFDLVVGEQSIRGSFAYTDADFGRAVELVAQHPEAFRLPTRTCSLEEGADVFEALVAGGIGGFVKASVMPAVVTTGSER